MRCHALFGRTIRRRVLSLVGLYRAWSLRAELVPWHQAEDLFLLREFASILIDAEIPHVLLNSTLLGAVRQGAFAGTVHDLDLGISVSATYDLSELDKLLLDRRYVVAPGFELFRHRRKYRRRYRLLWIGPVVHSGLVSVVAYRPVGTTKWRHIIESQVRPFAEARGYEDVPWECLAVRAKATLFGFEFSIPSNPEYLLTREYGDWRRVTDRQYAWYPRAVGDAE